MKALKTTFYYGSRGINYKTPYGIGYTMLTIFPEPGNRSNFERYLRNDETGYCRDYFTEKRISKARFEELEKTCKLAF